MGTMTQEEIMKLIGQMLEGSEVTLKIFFLTAVIALPLGLLIMSGRMVKIKPISYLFRLYLLIMRGTPLMLQLLAVYFIPSLVWEIRIERFHAAIIAMSLNYAAYFAEIYRSGFESMPVGQYEAATVLGFTRGQRYFKIILPQVVKKIIPPMGSEFMTLVKDTALVSCIAVPELFVIVNESVSRTASVLPLVMAAVFYLVMNSVVAFAFHMIERKLSYYK